MDKVNSQIKVKRQVDSSLQEFDVMVTGRFHHDQMESWRIDTKLPFQLTAAESAQAQQALYESFNA